MSNTLISGIVLRSKDKTKTAEFYQRLGLTAHHHQHGGPMHYEVEGVLSDFVVEIYQNSERFPRDAIMVEVGNIQKTFEMVKELCTTESLDIRETDTTRFTYIQDPDGRDVMLVEQK